MKPCYRRGDDFFLLAHVIWEGSDFSQPCKALISPCKCPTVTRTTREFLQRCGWHASKVALSEQGSEIADVQRAEYSRGQLGDLAALQTVHLAALASLTRSGTDTQTA
ncbi:hypothetical protein COCOBI_14-3780 [Coccomyxa sp. Obi]|nr:hypothetical protein COCOBI_14-3780 [Coccomyxa sp. Obi]